jgi:5-methylcytosine-specific restriction enzyme A
MHHHPAKLLVLERDRIASAVTSTNSMTNDEPGSLHANSDRPTDVACNRSSSRSSLYHLNQNSPAMATAIAGDSVWAFTRRRGDRLYALAAELVVRGVTRNPPNYRYGTFRVWGDLQLSRYFDIDLSPSAEPLIRRLSVRIGAQRLGQSFQGHAAVRPVSALDHQLLTDFARGLPVIERVHIYPEDEFEARLLHGADVRTMIVRESPAQMTKRQAYLFESGLVEPLQLNRHLPAA